MVVSLDLLRGGGGQLSLTAQTDVLKWAGALGRCYQGYYTIWASWTHCKLREHHSAKHIYSLKLKHTVPSPNIAFNYTFQVMKRRGEMVHFGGMCRDSPQSPSMCRISPDRLGSTAGTNKPAHLKGSVQLFISHSHHGLVWCEWLSLVGSSTWGLRDKYSFWLVFLPYLEFS